MRPAEGVGETEGRAGGPGERSPDEQQVRAVRPEDGRGSGRERAPTTGGRAGREASGPRAPTTGRERSPRDLRLSDDDPPPPQRRPGNAAPATLRRRPAAHRNARICPKSTRRSF